MGRTGSPQNPGCLTGDGGCHDLERLQHHKDDRRPGAKGFQKSLQLLFVEKEPDELHFVSQEGNAADEGQQQSQLDPDVILVVRVNGRGPLFPLLVLTFRIE